MQLDWERLFPSGEFRWRLGLAPGQARAFFAPTGEQASLLAERARWLATEPEEYALLTPEGAPLLAEVLALARSWGATPAEDLLAALGRVWEPDFVLLSLGDRGPVVEGGAVCFPTSWSLREKLGRTLTETHGPVVRLNAELESRIATALGKLPPGGAWERDNWGLVRTPERNRHPILNRPRLDVATTPDEVWLRVEHQLLFKLPQTGGILFGIRIAHVPFCELLGDPSACAGLHQALTSMADDAAEYKGLTKVRPRILEWLHAE